MKLPENHGDGNLHSLYGKLGRNPFAFILDEKKVANIDELAKKVGKERAVVSHTLQIAAITVKSLPTDINFFCGPAGNTKTVG